MTDPPPGSAGRRRPVQTTVDLSGLHPKALEALARDLFPGEVVRVVILGERDQAIIGTHRRALVFKKGFAGGALFTTEMISWDYAHLTGVRTQTSERAGAVMLEASRPGGPPQAPAGQLREGPAQGAQRHPDHPAVRCSDRRG